MMETTVTGLLLCFLLGCGLAVAFSFAVGAVFGGVLWRLARKDSHEEFKVIAGEAVYQPTCSDPDCEKCNPSSDDDFPGEEWKRGHG